MATGTRFGQGSGKARNEIKGYQSSPKPMKALGDVTRIIGISRFTSPAVTKNFATFSAETSGRKKRSDPSSPFRFDRSREATTRNALVGRGREQHVRCGLEGPERQWLKCECISSDEKGSLGRP